jgi:hypothetical protein
MSDAPAPRPITTANQEYQSQLAKAKGNVVLAQEALDRATTQLHRVEGAIAATQALITEEDPSG